MIGFAGLTHLGIVSSIAAAAKGFEVVAYDPDVSRCASLGEGRLPIVEPGLPELLAAHRARLRFSSDPAALGACNVVYVALDVPTDAEGHADVSLVTRLLDDAVQRAQPGATVVILSQVPPGFTATYRGALDRTAATRSLSLFYQVETLIFGRAVERALQPERIIVGCADPQAALPDPYAALLHAFGCPVLQLRYTSSELTKVAINMFLLSSITTANMLAELCESIGADWSEVVPALRLDRRIGAHAYLTPGLGIGGGNLERDAGTVMRLAAEHGTDAAPVRACLESSMRRRDWALRLLHREALAVMADPIVALWGLAYKADTASTVNSPALALVEALGSFRVRVYDPAAAIDGAGRQNLTQHDTALEAVRGADALAIMTPWPEFAAIDPARLGESMRGRVLLDPFGLLKGETCQQAGFRYFRLGAPARAASALTC